MNVSHHELSPEAFASLAAGGGEPGAIRELIEAEFSAHMILLASVVREASGSAQHQSAKRAFDVLVAALRWDRAAAGKVVQYPSIGMWARQTIRGSRGGITLPGAEPSGLGAIAAAAAIRARLPAELDVPISDGRVLLPSLGAAIVSGDTVRIRVSSTGRAEVGTVEVPQDAFRDTLGWRGLRRTQAGQFDVLLDDLDPFRMLDLPDLASGVNAWSWDRALREAWAVLDSHHPALATEVAAMISVVVPRSSPPSGVVSTTSPQAFGAIGMSLPRDPVTGAETFVHEAQHLKLIALQKIVDLTLPDDGTRYYAPWRDDPRPINGLLQGTYAYLGVAGFWRRQRQNPDDRRRADELYARWRAAAARSTETLSSSGRLTPHGAGFVRGMASTLAAWEREAVPAGARARARRVNEAHLTQWQSANGPGTGC